MIAKLLFRSQNIVAIILLSFTPVLPANDLFTLYRQAALFDPAFAAAQARYRAQIELEPQARARLLPNVSLVAGLGWVDHKESGALEHDRNNANAYALVLTQPLFRWEEVIAHDQAKLALGAAEIELEAARQALVLRVAEAYFAVILAQETHETLSRHRSMLDAEVEQSERGHREGAGTYLQVEALHSQRDLASARELAASHALALSQETLRQFVGQIPPRLAPFDERRLLQPPRPTQVEAWVEQARRVSLDVQAAELNLRLSQKTVDKRKAEHLPTVDLIAAHGRFDAAGGAFSGNTLPSENYDQTVVGVKMTLPLYAGGGTQSRIRQARALNESADYDLQDQQRAAEIKTRQAYLEVVNGISQYQALQRALQSSTATSNSVSTALEAGAAVRTEVLAAQDRVSDARLLLAQARHGIVEGQLRLLAASGQLDEKQLEVLDGMLIAR